MCLSVLLGVIFFPNFLVHGQQYKVDTVVNGTYKVSIGWDLNFEDETVDFLVEIKPGEKFHWFAFGISDIGEYPGSNVCLYKDRRIVDSYIHSSGSLRRSLQQECSNGQINIMPDGRTVLQFGRPFRRCDDHYIAIEPGTTLLLLAFGKTPRKNIFARTVAKKILPNRLLRPLNPPPDLPDEEPEFKSFVAAANNVEIPPEETTYWCTVVLLPRDMMHKNHIVKYEAAIDPGHEKYVHHMEVYHCEVPPDGYRMPKYSGPCTEHDRPAQVKSCRKVLAAWAMGADPFVYPAAAGIPVGGRDYYPFVLLETHYNNQELEKGIIDSSGIRFYYTPNLRMYDAGILETGLIYTEDMAIPPRQNAFPLMGYCTPDCTEAGFPERGITIFASQLHAHLSGHRLSTVLAREGVSKGDVNRDNHFVTHYQEIRHLETPVEVLPGDALITKCVYNSEKRSNVTLGGLSINDEMCVNYIHYYPRAKLEVCKSSIDRKSLEAYFDLMNRMEDQPTDALKSSSENYQSIFWSSRRVNELKALYKSAPIRMECLGHDGNAFSGKWDELEKPTIYLEDPWFHSKYFDTC